MAHSMLGEITRKIRIGCLARVTMWTRLKGVGCIRRKIPSRIRHVRSMGSIVSWVTMGYITGRMSRTLRCMTHASARCVRSHGMMRSAHLMVHVTSRVLRSTRRVLIAWGWMLRPHGMVRSRHHLGMSWHVMITRHIMVAWRIV